MKKHVLHLEIFPVRRLRLGVHPNDYRFDGSNSEWLCDASTYEEAMEIADREALNGRICVILNMTVVKPILT